MLFLHSFFFFSSRRRHTRWNCDWSSDVCSSDLPSPNVRLRAAATAASSTSAFTLRYTCSRWSAIASYSEPHAAAMSRPATVTTLILDRKSTRLNSSHSSISYAVFCLKKKKNYHDEHAASRFETLHDQALNRERGDSRAVDEDVFHQVDGERDLRRVVDHDRAVRDLYA